MFLNVPEYLSGNFGLWWKSLGDDEEAKKELAKGIPSISYNLKHGGSVTIDRKNPDESIEKIKNFAIDLNAKKLAVCIYPEGSRSKDGKVITFQDFATVMRKENYK